MSGKTRQLLTGNEAIARGAYEAGVTVCSARDARDGKSFKEMQC